MSVAQAGYARARVQARFAARPTLADVRALQASRTIEHLVASLAAGRFAPFLAPLGPAPDADAVETRFAAAWRTLCAEIAAWHDGEWWSAFAAFSATADLPALALLRAGGPVPAWLQADVRLGPIARSDGALRQHALRAAYGEATARAFGAERPLGEAWRDAWRSTWPATDRAVTRGLVELGWLASAGAVSDEAGFAERSARLERLVRRGAGTALASFAYLALLALLLARARGRCAALLLGPVTAS